MVLVLIVALAVTVLVLLVVHMPGRSFRGTLPPLSDEEEASAGRLEEAVRALSVDIGERNLRRYSALQAAASYTAEALSERGYGVVQQPFEAEGKEVVNLEAMLQGTSPQAGCIVVGGHYDSVEWTPGADDNASGVAAVVELARLLRNHRVRHDVRFVLFVNEEPPNFQTPSMGSLVYARALADRHERVVAMLSLETIGYFSSERGSQHYPFPLSLFYPRTGNFIGFVGNLQSRGLVRRFVRAFRAHAHFPSEAVAAPSLIPGVGWSDHWAFWQQGFPAIMVTDTALFRNPNYHAPTDTIETLDFHAMARVVHGLRAAIVDLDQGEL